MPETWLKSNQRVLMFAMAFPLATAVLGGLAGFLATGWLSLVAYAFVAVGVGVFAVLVVMLRRPVLALALDRGHLLVFLSSGEPERVPIELVEAFIRGEGPVSPSADDESASAANIVVRLAERAEDWKHRDIKSSLGQWCDGYITIRGMWCEPIDRPLMERLNRRLVSVHRERREDSKANT